MPDIDARGCIARTAIEPDAEVVGRSAAMRAMTAAARAASRYDCTILLHGESGTGKEVMARLVHRSSRRSDGPFVPVDCTTLTASLIESQLFGHVKGAFTGAERDALGFVRAADGGTLFLDEIGELPSPAQAKLLRMLQERVVVPVGSTRPVPVNVRVVSATHRDLNAMVAAGTFRQDLLFRLNVVRLVLPPLRERAEDIADLAAHFLNQLATLYGQPTPALTPGALGALRAHDWPGNVRELANALEHAMIFSSGPLIEAVHLPEHVLRSTANAGVPVRAEHGGEWLRPDQALVPLAVAERALIARALRDCGGLQSEAARLLGIERRRLYRKVRAHGLGELTRRAADA